MGYPNKPCACYNRVHCLHFVPQNAICMFRLLKISNTTVYSAFHMLHGFHSENDKERVGTFRTSN